MNKLKSLLRVFAGKAALCAVLTLLFTAVSMPLFAQTAEVRYAAVYYKKNDANSSMQNVYCDWSNSDGTFAFGRPSSTDIVNNKSFVSSPTPSGNTSPSTDPWVSSALIEYDQPYPSPTAVNSYPNHCLSLCMNVVCTNRPMSQSTYSISFPLQQIKFDVVKYYNNKNVENPEETPAVRTIDLYPNTESDNAKCGSYHCVGAAKGNPCSGGVYQCDSTTYCGSWNGNDDPYCKDNENDEPNWVGNCCQVGVDGCYYDKQGKVQVKTGTLSSAASVCGSYGEKCMVFDFNGTESGIDIPFCAAWDGSYEIAGEFGKSNGQFAFRATVATDAPGDNIITDKIEFNSTIAYPGMNQIPMQVDVTNIHTVRSTPSVVGNITAVSAQPYTYAYRLSKDADVRIAIFDASNKDNLSYGETTSTNTTTTKQKCADANFVAESTSMTADVCTSSTNNGLWGEFYQGDDWDTSTTGCCKNAALSDLYQEIVSTTTAGTTATEISNGKLVRTLVDWQPRLGEGMKGVDKDVQITEFDSWDGRNENGLLLPAGNYVVSLQAKSQDEWPGVDFSRAVTRQLSLDPLKLTDIMATGLNKQSTGYASISYVPTEPAKVYWNIYTPGTSFKDNNSGAMLTDSSTATGTPPTPVGGSLVYSSVEDRTGRMNFTSKWDGLCNQAAGCTRTYAVGEKMSNGQAATSTNNTETFAYGAPMPDGNYIYVLWAEIPYNGKYLNAAAKNIPVFIPGGTCSGDSEINNQCFTGVKTLKYDTGIVAIERGMVDITIQPVSYSTIGSSPTAYGLDPFIFKYSIVRDATAIAKVENTAGVVVKYLTPEEGVTQVAQQMNTLSWDGRDDAGRMVTPGTYMFVVETKDAMFPAVTNRAAAVFPVDMYRVVDVSTTDVYGDSEAKATISYHLSKAMNVQVNIYNKDVVIPAYNNTTGDYNDAKVVSSATGTTIKPPVTMVGQPLPLSVGWATITVNGVAFTNGVQLSTSEPVTEYVSKNGKSYRNTWTVRLPPSEGALAIMRSYEVTLLSQELDISATSTAAWPPRICDKTTDGTDLEPTDSIFNANGSVNPAKNPKCIYVNDTTFTNYPANATVAASGVVDVRLQPVKTFERSSTRVGDGMTVTEEWDALYFYNPTSSKQPGACAGSTNLKACPYEMVPDGQYPFFISARSNEPFDRYYANGGESIAGEEGKTYLPSAPFKTADEVRQENYLYATEKPVSKINVTRGPVYFLDGSTVVYPNAPQLFNVSSGPIFIPPYEINFAVSRAATVEVAIVALEPNVCNPDPGVRQDLKNNKAGDVCKFLSTMTIMNTSNFDPNVTRKIYWDGTDNNGFYVKPAEYEVRLTAKNYPDPGLYQETVKSITLNADLLKVFDLLEADGYAISQRGTDMRIGYQISVPMKVAIQIFKPGTTIYDYQKGTLRNPTTGKEVKDIHEVLVRAIVGIRPATTLIEEVWDGRDYAQQEVPDGTYPFRFVTALNSADIDSVTGEIVGNVNDSSDKQSDWKINKVADTYEYQNLHRATVAIGDGRFVCEDWEKTVFFYPNPLKNREDGTLEITKMPVPGKVSIKFFNLAGDLVKDSNYTCVDANNYQVTMGDTLSFNPDNVPTGSNPMTEQQLGNFQNIRNAALRCRWNGKNQHGKNVARGVYFGLVDFKAQNGREHCQKVVKVLIP